MKLQRHFFAWFLSALCGLAGVVDDYAAKIAPLIDPAKLATLKTRGANPRVQKAVYWLATGRADKAEPAMVIDLAIKSVGMTNPVGMDLTKAALLRNLSIAEKLGSLDPEGLAEMRRGHAPTVKTGPYTGDQLSVDHIIPRAVVPELDNVIANLELMPLRMNESKNASVTDRQRSLATKFHDAGLLSEAGYQAVLKAHATARPRKPKAPVPAEP